MGNQSAWERWQHQAHQAGLSVEELYSKLIGIDGITDYDSWVSKWQDSVVSEQYESPQEEMEQPYKIIDVTARDMSVLNNIDDTLSLSHDDRQPSNLSYDEMKERIIAVDKARDAELLSGM